VQSVVHAHARDRDSPGLYRPWRSL
jgi:hypothetical protein